MAIKSLFFLVLLGLVAHQATAFSCYTCSSTVNSANQETPTVAGASLCVDAGSSTSNDAGTYACETKFTNSDGSFTISRSISGKLASAVTESYCETEAGTTTCYCSSDKCNSHKVSIDRSYNCYTCSSSEYFDNGCGETLNSGSSYVHTTTGCSACYKNMNVDNDMTVRYQRGCSRGIQVEDSCYGEVEYGTTRKCACQKNLCNSAESHVIKFSTATAAVLLSAVIKYFY